MTDSPIALAQQTVAAESSDAKSVMDLIRELPVTNADEQQFAAEVLRDIKDRYNEIEKRRKAITVPINTALKEVNNLFRPVKEAYEESERILKGKISAYLADLEKANQLALQEAAEALTPEEAVEALAEVQEIQAPKGISVRKVWKFQVVSPDLVPYEYLCPDLEKIAAAAPGPVPGVKFFEEDIVTSRRVK